MEHVPEELLGKYKIERELGSGGMARVYLATLLAFDKPVAIKILHDRLSDDPDYINRFHREARAAIKLPLHPRVAFVHDSGRIDGLHFIVMEFVQGKTLKEFLKNGEITSVGQALDIAEQILEALEFIQEYGIVHRDVKPSNVMIHRDGSIKLTDFGVAREIQRKDITRAGEIIGTPEYMSPEQASGGKIDVRSDVFAVGNVLYEMLAGRAPFSAPTALASLYKVLKTPAEPIGNLVPKIPESLSRLVHRSLQKDPRHRFTSARDMLSDLHSVRSSLSGEALALPPGSRTAARGDDTVLKGPGGETTTSAALYTFDTIDGKGWSGWQRTIVLAGALGAIVTMVYLGHLRLTTAGLEKMSGSVDGPAVVPLSIPGVVEETTPDSGDAAAPADDTGAEPEIGGPAADGRLEPETGGVPAVTAVAGPLGESGSGTPAATVELSISARTLAETTTTGTVEILTAPEAMAGTGEAAPEDDVEVWLEDEEVRSALQAADEKEASGDYLAAIAFLERLLPADPPADSPAIPPAGKRLVLLKLGWNYLRLGLYGEALGEADRVLRVTPHEAEGHLLRGASLLNKFFYENRIGLGGNQDEYYEAESEIKYSLVYDPSLTEAIYYLGEIYLHREWYDRAKSQFLEVLSLDNSNARAHHMLGVTYLKLDQPHMARGRTERAISLNPNFMEARIDHVRVLLALDDELKAEKEARALVELAPEKGDVRMVYAEALTASRDYNGALDQLQKALEFGVSGLECDRERSRVFFLKAFNVHSVTVGEKVHWYQESLKAYPENNLARENLAAVYTQMGVESGDLFEKEKWYRKALEVDPDCLEARMNLRAIRARLQKEGGK